jgi:hypothetical protein
MISHSVRRSIAAGLLCSTLVALSGVVTTPASAATITFVPGAVRAIPSHVDPTALACPPGKAVTASTCYVLGSTSTASLLNAVKNGTPEAPPTSLTNGVDAACMNATTCIVGGANASSQGTLQWLTNGHVAKSVILANSSYVYAVTCRTTSCLAVGVLDGTPNSGVFAIVTEAQSEPTATKVSGVATLEDISCASPTSCYAVGSTSGASTGVGAVVPIVSGKAEARRLAGGTDALAQISCGSVTTCWATGTSYSAKLGITGSLVSITSGKPGAKLTGPQNGGALGCISATTCFVASGTKQYGKGEVQELVAGRVIKSVVLPAFAYGALSDITCPTAKACLATGATGFHNPGPSYFYTGGVVTITVKS